MCVTKFETRDNMTAEACMLLIIGYAQNKSACFLCSFDTVKNNVELFVSRTTTRGLE